MKKRSHGGKREGAGRPQGTGRFGEPTKAIRVPESVIPKIKQLLSDHKAHPLPKSDNVVWYNPKPKTHMPVPLYSTRVAAGFPSPSDEHTDNEIDLNEHLIKTPDSTFMVTVEGESMIEAGIMPGDILIVERNNSPQHNDIVIAAINGELTVKRLYKTDQTIKLMPENANYKPIVITEEMSFLIYGVVTGSVRKFSH